MTQAIETLSPQQHQLMQAVCAGKTWEQAAQDIGVEYGTMKTVRNRIFQKMGLNGLPRPALRAAYLYGHYHASKSGS